MSKIIDFNARDFHFDPSCDTNLDPNVDWGKNVGLRMHVTNFLGEDETVFEIGDWKYNWTQIMAVKELEKNTDYMFRFAIELGVNDSNDAVSQFVIYRDSNQEEREVYLLSQSKYQPVLSKNGPEGLLRIFEIPFQSGDAENTTFMFVAQHAVTRILPAHELQVYADFPDLTFAQWWEQRRKEMEAENGEDYQINLAGAHISQKTMEMFLDICGGSLERLNLAGAHISQAALAVLLAQNKKGINLAGAHIYEEGDNGQMNFGFGKHFGMPHNGFSNIGEF